MLMSALPAFAADSLNGPDLVITDIRINNPFFHEGSDIRFEIDVQNIGNTLCVSGWIWLTAKSGVETRAGKTSTGKWSKMSLYPGEKMTWSITDCVALGDEMTVSVLCDSSYSVAESNEGNNTLVKTFTSAKNNPDLIVTDISLLNSEFKSGDKVDIRVKMKNSGNVDVPYSEIAGELTADGNFSEFKTVQKLDAGEEVEFTIPSIPVYSNHVVLNIKVNTERKVTESDYANNSFSKDIYSVEEIDYTWSSVRIGGGGFVPIVELQKNDPSAAYIGTDVGGAFRYESDIDEWVPITNQIRAIYDNYSGIQAMQTDPDNPDIIYFSCGAGKSGSEGVEKKGGVFRSFDKGKTLTDMHVPPGDFNESKTKPYKTMMAIDPNNTNILYVVCPLDGLYRTQNAKDKVPKWEKLNVPGFKPAIEMTEIMTSVVVDPTSVADGKSTTIYVSDMLGGVYRSTDGGSSFELIPDSPLDCKMMVVNSKGELFMIVAVADGAIVKLEGDTFRSVAPYKDRDYTYFSINPFDENMMMASSTYDIFFSDNGGLTWRSVASRTTSDHEFQAPWHPEAMFANHLGFAEFDPTKNKAVWFGDWFGVWRTEDVTAERPKWYSKVRGLEEFCVRNLKPTSGKARLFVGAMDNCGVTSTDIFEFPETQFLNPKYQDTNCIDYAENNPDVVARIGGNGWGGKDGQGGYSTDGGFTWQPFEDYPVKLTDEKVKANNGYLAVATDPNDNGIHTIIATPINHFAYRTTDYGKTWTKIQTLPQGLYNNFNDYNDPIEADTVNKDVFYAYDYATGNFYLSKDNGVTFANISHLPKGDRRTFINALPGKEGDIFAAIGGTGLWHSTDYGAHFEKLSTVNTAYAFSIGKEAPGTSVPTLYIYGDVNGVTGIYRSCDLGKTWAKLKAPTEDFREIPSTLKADRKDFGVFYTVKGGNGVNVAIPSDLDIQAPRVVINSNIDGSVVRDNPCVIKGTATEKAVIHVSVNGKEYTVDTGKDNKFTFEAPVTEGSNNLTLYAVDAAGHKSLENTVAFAYDPSYINLTLDQSSGLCMQDHFTMTGSVNVSNKDNAILINDNPAAINPKTKRFSYTAPIHEGINTFNITAYDDSGNKKTETLEMNYDITPPSVTVHNGGITTEDILYRLSGTLSEACSVTIDDYTLQIQPGEPLDFTIPIQLNPGKNDITLHLSDPAGNKSDYNVSAEYKPKETAPAATDEVMVYTAVTPPVIDGVISDGEWYMNRVANRLLSGDTRAYAVFGVKGDSKYLYFAAKVWDNAVFVGGGGDYNLDTVELYFDPELNRATKYDPTDHQVRLGVLDNTTVGINADSRANVKMAYTLTDFGYIVEAAIPWDGVDVRYIPGMKFGFDVSINDNNQGGTASRDGAFGWQGSAYNYNNTSLFGTAIIQ